MTHDGLNALFAPTGVLRVAINNGNAILTRPGDGQDPAGVSVDLARAFAAERGLELELLPVTNAAASVALIAEERADIGFFAVDPMRAEVAAFTNPWLPDRGLVSGAGELTHHGAGAGGPSGHPDRRGPRQRL
ncbi:transporter substrate-binding domain-containing protein [Pannonibacter sp. Pt2-lr]